MEKGSNEWNMMRDLFKMYDRFLAIKSYKEEWKDFCEEVVAMQYKYRKVELAAKFFDIVGMEVIERSNDERDKRRSN